MRGVILAAGRSSRMFPATKMLTKVLLPIYDKPMIYYSLSMQILAGIRDILIITSAADQTLFQTLLGDGSAWGIALSYAIQPQPRGIAEALIIAENFLADDPVFLLLGDNLLYADKLAEKLQACANSKTADVFLPTMYAIRNATAWFSSTKMGSLHRDCRKNPPLPLPITP